ncbi:MAG: phosphoribosylamine--glycine ligase [bacterium]|nr:phosphoribosylamine--glycine ligase [bacterium]
MKVLIVGSGGREDAIAYKVKQSQLLSKLYCIPGNGGMAMKGEVIEGRVNDIPQIAKDLGIEFIIVGPEAPLVEGLADKCRKYNIPVFGPDAKGAQLEGSKVFAKNFMKKNNIPTAEFYVASSYDEAINYIERYGLKAIKADGLAGGKGVVIPQDLESAKDTLYRFMIEKRLGTSGERVVLEDILVGREISCFIVTDGKDYILLPSAQDYKRAYDGNKGPNTGGMGSVAPIAISSEIESKIRERIIERTLEGLERERIDYRGIIYFGLMLVNRDPYVLEYNVRLGDPETQAIIPLIEDDLLELFYETAVSRLPKVDIKIKPMYSCCVVLASGGYPEYYEIGKEIFGLEDISECIVFHAGTRMIEGKFYTAGGRVLNIVGIGESLESARKKAYKCVSKIKFENMFYRRDIGEGVKDID